MRLATLRLNEGTRAAVVRGDTTTLLPYPSVAGVLRAGGVREADLSGVAGPLVRDVELAPVIPHPQKIFCVGLNYRDHIVEMGKEFPKHPTLFAKFADALIGANDAVLLPAGSNAIDWEAELAVVVGATVRQADVEQAEAAIAGFAVANDISARDWQRRTTQWLQGKTFESTTPLGPVMVTTEEVGAAPDLEITCAVDDVTKQRSRTGNLLFGPPELVEYISRITTLRPGDVILTGTPGGVGAGRQPAEFLSPGQRVVTTIEGLGSCRNGCIEDRRAAAVPAISGSETRSV